MAAYNGSRFIREQIASILPQLADHDELIVVDDCSKDNTVALIERFGDSRIRLERNAHNLGVVQTFERALQLVNGDIIFLSDQDDLWHGNKVRAFMTRFDDYPMITMVISNGELIDAAGRSLNGRLYSNGSFATGVLANVIKNRYQGSTMALRREVAEVALPFPRGLPMHDSWIGLVNSIIGNLAYLDESLLFYRRHESTVTTPEHGSGMRMLAQRWNLMMGLVSRAGKLLHAKRELKRKLPSRASFPASGY